MAKRILGVLSAVLIMTVTTCFGIVTASAEEVQSTTASDNALDNTDTSVDESEDEGVTDDELTDDDLSDVEDEEITDDEMTDDTTSEEETKPSVDKDESPKTGDTAMPVALLALALLSGGTAVAGYKVKKSK